MVLPLSLSLAGCVAPARVGVEYCDHARPVYFDTVAQVDATPAPIRRQILGINSTWGELCNRK